MDPSNSNRSKSILSPKFWGRVLSPAYLFYMPGRMVRRIYWSLWKRTVGRIKYGISRDESYAQNGEDLIVLKLWKERLGKTAALRYLDIGAHHPSDGNNTCLLYKKGMRGINIEPDPVLFEKFPEERPEDVNLNIGIGIHGNDEADFHIMDRKAHNTFSREMADEYVARNDSKLVKIVKVPLRTIQSVLDELGGKTPDFVSIDAEGLDVAILQSWDFARFKPAIFCVETDKKTSAGPIGEIMEKEGYIAFERTGANTIYYLPE